MKPATTTTTGTVVLGEFRVEPRTAEIAQQLFAVLDEHGMVAAEFESNLDAFAFASRRNAELMRARAGGASPDVG